MMAHEPSVKEQVYFRGLAYHAREGEGRDTLVIAGLLAMAVVALAVFT